MADMLASLQDLADLLGKDVADLNTTSATIALQAATAVVQEAAGGQRILRVDDDEDEIVVESWSSYLALPQRPVVSVASVSLDGTTITPGTETGTWRRAGNRVYCSTGWLSVPCEPSTVLVVYTHGLLPTDQRIQLARGYTASIAASVADNPTGVASERIDDYAVTYAKASAAMEAAPSMRAALHRQYGRKASFVAI